MQANGAAAQPVFHPPASISCRLRLRQLAATVNTVIQLVNSHAPHIASILDKLELRDQMQVMIYALKRGLVHIDDLP